MSSSCPICCEEYNKSTRKEVTCLKCNESFCSFCVKKYIIEEACICLSCKCEWDVDFLSSVLTKNFMTKDYREMQRKKLFDKELALLPLAMPLAEMTLKKETLQKRIDEVNKKIRGMYDERQVLDDEIAYFENVLQNPKGMAKYKPETISRCPAQDCRGFITKKEWKCGICNIEICKSCLEVKNTGEIENHTCKEENVQTAKMILKECKPCPKCAAQIYKIEGCDQMYCVQCNTAFSWNTGKIETGRIHNPHYYEWVRQNNNGVVPREPGDNPGGEACNEELIEYYRLSGTLNNNHVGKRRQYIINVHRLHVHLTCTVLENLTATKDNTNLRINYLLNRITKEYYEKEIEKRDRLEKRNQAIANILQLYLSVVAELLNSLNRNLIELNYDKNFDQYDWATRAERYRMLNDSVQNIVNSFVVAHEQIRSFTNETFTKLAEKLNISLKRYLIQEINDF